MGRILAIDYGRKKSGIAVTDPLQIVANGLDTVPSSELMNFLDNYLNSEQVDVVVMGYARQNTGEDSESMKYIKPFYNRLRNKYPHLNVQWIDEWSTSKMAFQTMIDGGLKRQARRNKELVDKISATIILQSYLEQKGNFKL